MKKLLIINPNSSEEMTRDIRNTLAYAQDGDFALEVVSTPGSPHVLESFSDYTEAGANVIALLRRLAAQGPFPYDGVLLACMGDPCLFAVKEACPVPLVGIAEAGISTALLLGYKFSILAASAKAKPMMESMVLSYGLTDRLASVETFAQPIDAFMEDPQVLRDGIRRTAEREETRGLHDRFEEEKLDFHRRVREAFLKIAAAEPERVRVVDADRAPELVHAEIGKIVHEAL